MQQRSHSRSMAIAVLLALLAATMNGCGGAPGPATPEGITVPAPTTAATTAATETPTSPPSPTATSAPTNTPMPTDTPRPTATATEPPTPTPSATPLPISTPTPVVVVTPIGEIGTAHIGQEVTVEGVVVKAAGFSSGFTFTLDDGSGQIVLLMWHPVYDDCWDAVEINIGARVRATGEVSEYEGRLQIEPDFGGDVKALEGAAAWATARQIGTLSGADADQRVMIEGEVVRVESHSRSVKVFVKDETGEIVVFLWRTVLDRIAANTALGTPGSRVRVIGTVSVYRNNLELIPTLPNDVIVLSGE